MTQNDRAATHTLVDNLIALDEVAGPPDFLSPTVVMQLAREIRQLRADLETRTNELHVAERALAEVQNPDGACSGARCTRGTAALIEALDIAHHAGRRGFLSGRERIRLRELARAVPQ